MGKASRLKRERRLKKQKGITDEEIVKPVKPVIPMTESERNKKITNIMFKLAQKNMDHIVTDELKSHMNSYIKEGKEYIEKIELPEYSIVIEVNLYNDKNKETCLNLSFRRIRLPDQGEDHPINKLNSLQENVFQV